MLFAVDVDVHRVECAVNIVINALMQTSAEKF